MAMAFLTPAADDTAIQTHPLRSMQLYGNSESNVWLAVTVQSLEAYMIFSNIKQ